MERLVVVAKPDAGGGDAYAVPLPAAAAASDGGFEAAKGDAAASAAAAAAAAAGGGGGGGGPLACLCCMGGSCAYDPSAPRELRRCACWRRATCPWRCGYCCCATLSALLLALICLCIATASTTTVDCAALPGYAPGSAAANVPVVFVHGYTGSLLYRSGALVYLTALQAIGAGAPSLALPAAWVGNIADAASPSLFYQQRDGVTVPDGPAGLILDVRLTDCFAYEAYRTYVLWSQRCMNRPFYAFTYDWRRDQLEVSDALIAYVRGVSAANGGAKVQVVGHSNGGLLGLMLINRAPGLVHSAVFVAAAVNNGVGGAGSFNAPYVIGLTNTKSFPTETRFTATAEFGFIALTQEDLQWRGAPSRTGFVDAATGAPYALDLTNPQVWLDYGLTSVRSAADPGYPALAAAIARGVHVRRALRFNASIAYPPSVVVTSHYNASMSSGNFSIDALAKTIDFKNPVGARRPGDGSVCADCAMPPYTPSGGVVLSTHPRYSQHFLLMNDIKAIKAAMDAVGPYPSAPVPAT